MKKGSILFLTLLLGAIVIAPAYAQKPQTKVFLPIESEASALFAAHLLLMGNDSLNRLDNSKCTVEKLPLLSDSTTPFLKQFASNSSVWKIHVDSFRANFKISQTRETTFVTTIDIYFDSAKGKPLKILCKNGELDPNNDLEISSEDAERQIGGGEVYAAIPDLYPMIGLVDIFERGYNALYAKEILIQYVLYSQKYIDTKTSKEVITKPRAVWVVTMRGIPPVEPRGVPPPINGNENTIDWMPIYMRNRMRAIVNASTGNLISTTTIPSVQMKPEDRERIFGNPKK